MQRLYKIANFFRRIYWYFFRPETSGVKCLIESDGEYLLIQTSYSGKYWTLPGGGRKPKESLEQAVKREACEEVGIKLDSVRQIGQYESTTEYKKDTVHLFYAQTPTKNFRQNKAELSAVRWFPKDALPDEQSRALRESISMLGGIASRVTNSLRS